MGKRHEEKFHKRGYTEGKSAHGKSSASLSIMEMHIKATGRYVHMSTKWQKQKIVTAPNAVDDTEKLD